MDGAVKNRSQAIPTAQLAGSVQGVGAGHGLKTAAGVEAAVVVDEDEVLTGFEAVVVVDDAAKHIDTNTSETPTRILTA